jgi:hypothetical protein
LPIIIGLQLILSFLGYDMRSIPIRPFHHIRRNSYVSLSNKDLSNEESANARRG